MEKWTGLLLAWLCSPLAQAGTADGILFESTPDGLMPAIQVEDSVFWYQADERDCDQKNDKATPCIATVDHWETICFQSDALESVCSAFQNLFEVSRERLMQNGAEEDVELVSCRTDSGFPVLTYNLWSFHGGSNIQLKDKKIPSCPSLSH